MGILDLRFLNREGYEEMTLKYMFTISCITNTIINLDHGIMPACTTELMDDLNISPMDLGWLGSLVYAGLLLGSVAAGILFDKMHSKHLMLIAGAGNVLSLILFSFTSSYTVLCVSRFLTGFFQEFFVIYFPVWVDRHGAERKTAWLTILQVCVPLGVVIGYGMTALALDFHSWRFSYYVQIGILSASIMCFFGVARGFMSTGGNIRKSHPMRKSLSSRAIEMTETGARNSSPPKLTRKSMSKSAYGMPIGHESPHHSFIQNIVLLWGNSIFRNLMLAITILYFVITGIQFWITEYWRNILGVDKATVYTVFSFISITGPTIGVIIGGSQLEKIGGYNHENAFDFTLKMSILASLFGSPIPFIDNIALNGILLWLMLFFGGSIMPGLIGMMISSMPVHLRAVGNSFAQIIQNLFGYFPAPFVYGSIVRMTGGDQSRWGMIFLMYWGYLGSFFSWRAKVARAEVGERLLQEESDSPIKLPRRKSFIPNILEFTEEEFHSEINHDQEVDEVLDEKQHPTVEVAK